MTSMPVWRSLLACRIPILIVMAICTRFMRDDFEVEHDPSSLQIMVCLLAYLRDRSLHGVRGGKVFNIRC